MISPRFASLARPPIVAVLALLGTLAPLRGAGAQAAAVAREGGARPAATASTTVAVLDLLFVSELANAIQPADSLVAPAASATLRQRLAEAPGVVVLDSARLASALGTPAVVAAAGGKSCAAVIACATAVQAATGARWVAAGRLTKISSLVWVFTAQLIDGSTGRLVMNDEYEVKGAAGDMAEMGARVFARRVVKKMTADAPAPVGR